MSIETKPSPPSSTGAFAQVNQAVRAVCRGLLESLPGQLFMLTVGFIALAVLLVYFPAAASFRTQWMTDRAEAAHLAALAADVAGDRDLGDEMVRQLLEGADAVAVSRVRNGMNELVLYSGPIGDVMIESDLRTDNWLTHIRDTNACMFSEGGRLLRIRAEPDGHPGEVIDVIVRETPLREALGEFSRRFLFFSTLIALAVGAVIYLALFVLFVRPMRRLADSMIHFREDPNDPSRAVQPSGSGNEIGQAETELALMQSDVRQALHQRERLAALGSAVAKVNHDLRNVLTTAQLVSDRLALEKDSRVRGMGERLVRAVDRGVKLCEETLKFGRAEEAPPSKTHIEISDLLDEIAGDAMLAEGEVEWRNEVDLDVVIDADPDHTHRIFLNLFSNAIQAMQTGTKTHLLAVTALLDGGFVSILVSDTGSGLPEQARERLFEAFTGSARKGGTGLGLSTARELARAHGGDVILISTGDEGTVFGVKLPGVG